MLSKSIGLSTHSAIRLPGIAPDCMIMQLLEDQDSADEDFWNQDFFAEEEKDQEFEASESEEEDVPDSDFSEDVSH